MSEEIEKLVAEIRKINPDFNPKSTSTVDSLTKQLAKLNSVKLENNGAISPVTKPEEKVIIPEVNKVVKPYMCFKCGDHYETRAIAKRCTCPRKKG